MAGLVCGGGADGLRRSRRGRLHWRWRLQPEWGLHVSIALLGAFVFLYFDSNISRNSASRQCTSSAGTKIPFVYRHTVSGGGILGWRLNDVARNTLTLPYRTETCSGGVCVCDAAWTGPNCSSLNFLPANKSQGFNHVGSSWSSCKS